MHGNFGMAINVRWAGAIFFVLLLVNLGESAGGSIALWSDNVSGNQSIPHSWLVLMAGVFVVIALLLSMFLIIEHLAFYNQPEVCLFCIFFAIFCFDYYGFNQLLFYHFV